MRKNIIAVCLILLILCGCTTNQIGSKVVVPINNVLQKSQEKLSQLDVQNIDINLTSITAQISQLPYLELNTIERYEQYKELVDKLNDLIELLNKESDTFNLEKLDSSSDAWEKALRTITEYGPLINNYNEVVKSAKEYQNNQNDDLLKKFYLVSGKFAFELSIIIWAVFYGAAYESVGIVYRSIGLNRFAFKCPTCIKIILSEAHWNIRTMLVEKSSEVFDFVNQTMVFMQKQYELEGGWIGISSNINSNIREAQEYIRNLNISLSIT